MSKIWRHQPNRFWQQNLYPAHNIIMCGIQAEFLSCAIGLTNFNAIGMNLNKVFILGNLTRDPELRQTSGGQAVCSFGVATNRRYTDKSGQKQEQVEFHNLVAWGRQAEIIAQYLHKGSMILVEGRLQTRSWQDAQGAKHWKTEVIVDEMQLGPKPQGGDRTGGSWGGGTNSADSPPASPANLEQKPAPDPMPIIELPDDGEEIDIKDIPF